MLLPVKFKLKPSEEQALKAQSWRPMVRGLLNFCLRDRIDSYTQIFIQGPFCDLKSKGEAVPLTCSVNKSASVGNPWKAERKAHRDSKKTGVKKGDTLPPSKRPAFEMHSSSLAQLKLDRPWYKSVNADVLQQALRNQDKAFQNFFAGRTKFPRFKRTSDVDSLQLRPGGVRYDESSRRVYIPTLGWVGYFKSRELLRPEFPESTSRQDYKYLQQIRNHHNQDHMQKHLHCYPNKKDANHLSIEKKHNYSRNPKVHLSFLQNYQNQLYRCDHCHEFHNLLRLSHTQP